jgi:XTP/dITP diphosphohydrolase
MPPSHPILLATANPHKVEELRAILAGAGTEAIDLAQWRRSRESRGLSAPLQEPRETGRTFEENSAIKAISYAEQTGSVCLADDSGLEIDALQGRPGVISSHYASDGRELGLSRGERDRANNQRVLRELEGVPPSSRSARFVCVMTLACPGRILLSARGTFEGRIGLASEVPRGDQGFGYDPLFLVAPDFARTGAELTSDEKNVLSHRAKAAGELARLLRERPLGDGPEGGSPDQ